MPVMSQSDYSIMTSPNLSSTTTTVLPTCDLYPITQHIPDEILVLIAKFCVPSNFNPSFVGTHPTADGNNGIIAHDIPKLVNVRLASYLFNEEITKTLRKSFSGEIKITDDIKNIQICSWAKKWNMNWLMQATKTLSVESCENLCLCGCSSILPILRYDNFRWPIFQNLKIVQPIMYMDQKVNTEILSNRGKPFNLKQEVERQGYVLRLRYCESIIEADGQRKLKVFGMPEGIELEPLLVVMGGETEARITIALEKA